MANGKNFGCIATADELTEALDRLRMMIESYRERHGIGHPSTVAATRAWYRLNGQRQRARRAE